MVSVFMIVSIIAIAAITSGAGRDAYAFVGAAAVMLLIFGGALIVVDVLGLIIAIKLIRRIESVEAGNELYDMQNMASQPHPQPIMSQTPAVYPYPMQTQQQPQFMPVMTVPMGANMGPMATAPQYNPQQMGVVYTQPYAVPQQLSQ